MDAPSRLAELQRWMLEAVLSPDRQAAGIERTLEASMRQSAAERMAVYQNAYFARLIECLRELFPVLLATLGEEDFDRFAAGYLVRYPPQSYTLSRLGDRFADYLQETRPDVPPPDWPDFLIELARVERTIDEVFDGPGIEDLPPLDAERLRGLSPGEFPALRLVPAPCLRLLALSFPVNDYIMAVRHGERPAWPRPAPTYLAITRRDYVVRRVELSRAEYRILVALSEGESLAAALAAAGEPLSPPDLANWFAAWGRLGLFTGWRAVPETVPHAPN